MTLGGPTDPGSEGCDAMDQRDTLLRLADWVRRAAEGMALITAPEALVDTEIVTIRRHDPSTGEPR